MDRQEIVNSQDYKATKVAIEWWYSLPEEQRKATDIDAEPDIIDAYSDGVIYGWNNPQWIPVEERLPEEKGTYLFHFDDGQTRVEGYFPELHLSKCVTHWMPIVPPRKED